MLRLLRPVLKAEPDFTIHVTKIKTPEELEVTPARIEFNDVSLLHRKIFSISSVYDKDEETKSVVIHSTESDSKIGIEYGLIVSSAAFAKLNTFFEKASELEIPVNESEGSGPLYRGISMGQRLDFLN
ncbi:MAG: hypothetical protein AAF244_01745 [Pseudomonadota bacterium]